MKLPARLEFSNSALQDCFEHLQKYPMLLLQIPDLRHLLARDRVDRIQEQKIEVHKEKSEEIHDHTLTHNLNNILDVHAIDRAQKLVKPLSCVTYIARNIGELKVLSIGPRSESELFSILAAGFKEENVYAIDLFSYSDYIKVADMHKIPYKDSSFDIVIAGWVFAYSNDNEKAAQEILRVTKPGGFCAVGCRTEPIEILEEKDHHLPDEVTGGLLCVSEDPEREGKKKTVSRFWNTGQIERLFADAIDQVIFRSDPDPREDGHKSHAILIFRTKFDGNTGSNSS